MKKTPVDPSYSLPKGMKDYILPSKKPACKEYLGALDLPQLFAGQPGSRCPSCGSDNVDVKNCSWKCQKCKATGELQVQAVVMGQDAKDIPCTKYDNTIDGVDPNTASIEEIEEMLSLYDSKVKMTKNQKTEIALKVIARVKTKPFDEYEES